MSSYEKTLQCLKEFKTMASHITTLGKIKAATEDASLSSGLDVLIRSLQQDHVRAKNKSTPISLENASAPEVTRLVDYCKRAIGTRKPEWQILAERHGWAPAKA